MTFPAGVRSVVIDIYDFVVDPMSRAVREERAFFGTFDVEVDCKDPLRVGK